MSTAMQKARSVEKNQGRKPLQFPPEAKGRLKVACAFLRGKLTVAQAAAGLEIHQNNFHWRICRIIRNAARNNQIDAKTGKLY